jgi:hypothetical protein
LILNPLFLYAAICTTVLVLYLTAWSALYAPLSPQLLAFLVCSIAFAALAGLILQNSLGELPPLHSISEGPVRVTWRTTLLVLASFTMQFLLVGQVPFFDVVLNGATSDYGRFPQIAVLGVLLTTFSIFYTSLVAYRFVLSRGRARLAFGTQFAAIELMFLLLLNREAMVICLISASLIILSYSTKHSFRRTVLGCAIALLAMYVFGGMGNLREGDSFFNNEHIVRLAHLTAHYPDWVPKQFVWAYMYVVSPLGNLNYAAKYQIPLNDFGSTIVNLVPDFATKRLFSTFDPQTPIVADYFNVSTGFSAAWKFNGFLGLWITFFALVALVIFAVKMSKGPWMRISLALSGAMVTFMFFHNTLTYSGVSFALAYPVFGTLMGVSASGRSRIVRNVSIRASAGPDVR